MNSYKVLMRFVELYKKGGGGESVRTHLTHAHMGARTRTPTHTHTCTISAVKENE